MKISNVTLGADPELFIINTKTGLPVSAIGIIPGKKDNPYTEGMPKGFGVELDCILGEFNIPPCSSKSEFVESIKYMKNWIRDYIKNINEDLDICCASSMMIPETELQDPEAHILGCDPSFNAYSMDVMPRPDKYPDNVRNGAFHIHIGTQCSDPDVVCKITRFFDLCCGVPSILYDRDTLRRRCYGQAGDFRFQKWGQECRCLGGYMLNDQFLEQIYNGTMLAIEMFNEGLPLPEGDLVQKCINTSNEVLAKHLIKLYDICVE